MRELNNTELMEVFGGGTSIITAAFLNSAARLIDTIMSVGRSLGSSIRRAINGSYCPL